MGAFGFALFGSHPAVETLGYYSELTSMMPFREAPQILGMYAGLALLLATAPFAVPISRFLRK